MAIDPILTSELEQAHLDDLVAETDLVPSASDYVLPEPGTFDPKLIEIIVDLDLDEMLLYFYGRNIPHDVERQSELLSYLIESGSDRAIGVIVHEFTSRAVREYPSLSQAMRWAIIVSGDKVQTSVTDDVDTHARKRDQFRPWNRIHELLLRRLMEKGRERTAETVQALLRTA